MLAQAVQVIIKQVLAEETAGRIRGFAGRQRRIRNDAPMLAIVDRELRLETIAARQGAHLRHLTGPDDKSRRPIIRRPVIRQTGTGSFDIQKRNPHAEQAAHVIPTHHFLRYFPQRVAVKPAAFRNAAQLHDFPGIRRRRVPDGPLLGQSHPEAVELFQ